MGKQKKHKHAVVDKINRALDLSPDLLLGGITVEVISGRQAVVEGIKNRLEYDDNVVRVNDNKTEVRLVGTGLSLRCMTPENIVIDGVIHSVEYQEMQPDRG